MLSLRAPFKITTLPTRRLYSLQHAFRPVPTITGPLDSLPIEEFRSRAFVPEKPLLITAGDSNVKGVKGSQCTIPAAEKWFKRRPAGSDPANEEEDGFAVLSQEYLAPFGSTILPHELITPKHADPGAANNTSELDNLPKHYTQHSSPGSTFHHFSAPLSLFLLASKSLTLSQAPPQLYIAQAQLLSLPPTLQTDLPTPSLITHAGKGDIYDSNLWLGIPPTYTPLHKDPNPNLFIQLAGRKRVRMFKPRVGQGVFWGVQEKIGRGGGGGRGQMRGSEMMEGPEREVLFEAVWGEDVGMVGREERRRDAGFETVVRPGDALFIPKGWWHSFRSVGEGITGSVNWWFR
ncbi:hypothetical protein ONS95_004770 [Cadophora gregata]|uniref:uncharacterized protein n=1 Tax=Cadophora gregata TaxID=51156 RepID=UPI0026DB7504|nr:uncharacterized protein ONS95_004770 [Cadophora gregata]KAK0104481.1 hypothetical protein ONS95_004770 [Cadophora gregata]